MMTLLTRASSFSWAGLLFCSSSVLGCSGSSSESKTTVQPEQTTQAWSTEDVQRTWVFQAADSAWRGQFEGDPGWTALFNRDYQSALSDASGFGSVRMYSEFSAIYRQATLMHAHATFHLYDTDRQEEDGNDTLYLRGVAQSIRANWEAASVDFAAVEDEKLQGMAKQWAPIVTAKGWTAESELVGNFVNMPAVKMGAKFRPESVPHFTINTTIEGIQADVTDSTELWVRAKWYESMAIEAAKQSNMDPRWVDVFMGPWVIPFERTLAKSKSEVLLQELKAAELDASWLFLSRNLVAEDALFLYALHFTSVSEALNTWKSTSVLAKIMDACMVEGLLDVPKVLDAASALELEVLAEMQKSQGKEEPFYLLFADFAEQAVLIAGVMVAEQNGQREDSGRLRMNARDLALQNSKDALFLTGFAAWDVANRYPLRAQDMVHKYNRDFPAFKVAGHPLGTLQIRLGRNAGVPGAAN